ncbi:MAG: carotenoid 1,2-hydratase [Terriglobia bacterium]|nr:MAG: carotenoid 1,2-hydratase [Terriglobia bacterium]
MAVLMRVFLCLVAGVSLLAAPEYRQAAPGYGYQFPRDHFDHREFRTEWWYYTGNLHAQDGHRFGFELVFFRQGENRGRAGNPSTWRVDDLYLAHLALTDIDAKRYRYYKRLNRAGPGIAGISFEEGRIWNGNWQCEWDKATGAQDLSAVADGIRFRLHLTSRKPPVINGENGISRKGEGAGQASYYVSLPRLEVEGTLNGAGVTGTAWMDHEWFTNQLSEYQAGWDWFSVQLENNTELMLFEIRHLDGSIDPYSAGTFVDRTGKATHLSRAEFELKPLEFWTSPKTGARYPLRWRITVPAQKLVLECAAAVPDQELVSEDASAPTYWEGAVTYRGSANGVGYLELTGYLKPMRL